MQAEPVILFAAKPEKWAEYEAPLRRALRAAGVADGGLCLEAAPQTVDYIIYAPNPALVDFTPYTKARAVLSLWAGVEAIVGNPTLTQPLARMVDRGLTQGMVEWVTGHVLRHHLGMDAHILHGQDGVWRNEIVPPLADQRVVAILGLGELGASCAKVLAGIGFDMRGWSRSEKSLGDMRCFHGADGLTACLSGAQIVVNLLPHTPATENILNATTLGLLAQGAVVINPGRGGAIDDAALLAALDTGRLSHATLDVFRTEPLPADHPYWAHPRVTVTPHIASATRPDTAAEIIAENIRRGEAGAALLHLVDRAAGY